MAEQALDHPQVGAGLDQMRDGIVARIAEAEAELSIEAATSDA